MLLQTPAPLACRSGDIQFVAIAEAGILETQALLLCESIRTFAGAYASSLITVVSPRSNRRPSLATRQRLDKLDVEYLELDIETPRPEYGPSFRVHAAAHVEGRAGPPILVQVDSDTLFLGEPDFALDGIDLAARPVDLKGMCTAGADDPCDAYWRHLCTLTGVNYEEVPLLTTTVDQHQVRASYNAGLVAVRRGSGLFSKTEQMFVRIVQSEHGSHVKPADPVRIGSGYISPHGFAYWGTSQAAISLACTASRACVRILPISHNVPLHYFNDCAAQHPIPPVHVHYHWLGIASECSRNPLLDGRIALPRRTLDWLRRRLPLAEPVGCPDALSRSVRCD